MEVEKRRKRRMRRRRGRERRRERGGIKIPWMTMRANELLAKVIIELKATMAWVWRTSKRPAGLKKGGGEE